MSDDYSFARPDAAIRVPIAEEPAVAGGDGLPIDEDLYCLQCGYNLRGLYGDPVRCPECGFENDLGTARLPAGMIRNVLHQMETYPARCVVMTLGLAAMTPMLLWGDAGPRAVAAFGLLIFGVGWGSSYRGAGECFRDLELCRRILLDFHAIVLICLLPFIIPFVLRGSGLAPRSPGVIVWLFLISFALCWIWGLRMYAASRKRLANGQREAAVGIARATLRVAMREQTGRVRRSARRDARGQ